MPDRFDPETVFEQRRKEVFASDRIIRSVMLGVKLVAEFQSIFDIIFGYHNVSF